MGRFRREFEHYYSATRSDIFKFCQALNFKPTFQQRQLFEAVQRGSRQIAVRSGQGPGKTTAASVVALFRLWRQMDAQVVVTAPTMRQCKDVFMVEVRRVLERADPLLSRWFDVTKTRVEVGGRPDWTLKLATATKVENAQGFHAENLTVIGEEASGISREIITQFKGTLSNPNSLFLQIGNPNTRDCGFFDCFNSQRDKWVCLRWNAEETPESPWFSYQRNGDLEEEFGRDSDVYRIRVLGEFPYADPNCVMSSDDLERVMNPDLMVAMSLCEREPEFGGGIAKQFGMDFARFGGDESTIYQRQGNAILQWRRFARTEPARVVEHAFLMQHDWQWPDHECTFVGDAGGMGQGIMHLFHDANKRIHEFHNQGRPRKADYADKITEAWFRVRKLVLAKNCCMPKDNILLQQLTSRQYFTNKKGKIVLESKDDYMKRGHESPDRADGCVLAFYDGAEATGLGSVGRVQHRSTTGERE